MKRKEIVIIPANDVDWSSMTSLRTNLKKFSLDTSTPGLRGSERHKALTERLKGAMAAAAEAIAKGDVEDTDSADMDDPEPAGGEGHCLVNF